MFDSITNRGEYFSDHYFDSMLQANLKQLRARWDRSEGRGESTPRSRLRGMSKAFSAARARATESGDTTDVHVLALDALGFAPTPGQIDIERGGKPVETATLTHVDTATGLHVVAVDAGNCNDLDELLAAKLPVTIAASGHTTRVDLDEVVSAIFATAEPPRFVVLCGGAIYALADRLSWSEGKLLAVDLGVALERNDAKPTGELATIAALFSADAIVPVDGSAAIDELRDASLKHAVGVSNDLREGIRESVELIANDVIASLRNRRQGVFNQADLPRTLTTESLRFLYRLLFLLFAEARRELGILPVDAPEYAEGYGIDRLRDLALTKLSTEKALNGSHLYESLALLFRLVNDGSGTTRQAQLAVDADEAEGGRELEFRPLKSELFSPQATPTIDSVGLANRTLQQVLQLLMLSKERRGRDRGFVSYGQLGINQLGAVYEGLMAYTGFFATEDLIELQKTGKEDRGSWVAPLASLGEWPDENVKMEIDEHTGQPQPVVHSRGSFVFRLSGRDRQRSASYYTPEVLTRCVVKHALAELLDQDDRITPAAEILELKVCEPALGSGAFVNEAINQLAVEYLRRRQHELGEDVEPTNYIDELQKVKAHLALHQCYGVDLNRTAVELAEVSMWLNCMHEGLQAPWFGLHLRRGNSLIGAQRSTYTHEILRGAKWYERPAHDRSLSAGPIGNNEIHHFLLPAHGWGAAGDAKEAKELRKDQAESLRLWRKSLLKPVAAQHLDRLGRLAKRVEALWQRVVPMLDAAERGLRRPLDVWGATATRSADPQSAKAIDDMLTDTGSPLGRLRLIMDAWCAMWFWPLDGERPPTMEQWLSALEGVLGRGADDPPTGQLDLFAGLEEIVQRNEQVRFAFDQRLVADVLADHPWLAQASTIAEREGFWHWELEWAHVFEHRGFDLQVGNPPWVRPRWEDDAVLGEFDPWFGLVEKAPDGVIRSRRAAALAPPENEAVYVDDVTRATGLTTILGSAVVHPVLRGVQTNLYMLFMEKVWRNASADGISGLIHPEGHFTDPAGGQFRRQTYRRLRRHFHFRNELKLFEDISNTRNFGVCVYGSERSPEFVQIASLFDPSTLDGSFLHDGQGEPPGIQYPAGGWDLRPHAKRLVRVDTTVLGTWAGLFDSPGIPAEEARPLRLVTTEDLASIVVLARFPRRLADLDYQWTRGFEEDRAKQDGTMTWRTEIPSSSDEVILQGPHFTVATPLAKRPNEGCRNNKDYSQWDLESMVRSVVPRTNYQRSCERDVYDARIEQWWGEPNTSYWRLLWRRMAEAGTERSLHSCLLTPGPTHVHTCHSLFASEVKTTAVMVGLWATLPFDYLVKLSGKSDVQDELVRRFPTPFDHPLQGELLLRALRLNCLTADYAPLWQQLFDPDWTSDAWAQVMPGRPALGGVDASWTMATPLRSDYDRRLALVELDALAALMLGLSAEQLCAMYRTQFAVLRKYEYEMHFDANGRKIARNHHAYGQTQEKGDWEGLVASLEADGGDFGRYRGPFVKADREAEMTRAYGVFTGRLRARAPDDVVPSSR